MIFQLILGVVLVLFVLAVRRWQEPNRPMTKAEIERYLDLIDKGIFMLSPEAKADFLSRLRTFGAEDDGRDIYMLNLLRFFDKVQEGPGLDPEHCQSPAAANLFYEQKILSTAVRSGAVPIFGGTVENANVMASEPADGRYDRVILMHYPSRRHFFRLFANPEYQKYAAYKYFAMDVELVPVKRDVVIPDIRFLAATVALVIFFAAGWLNAL